jgi:hypothetical protein
MPPAKTREKIVADTSYGRWLTALSDHPYDTDTLDIPDKPDTPRQPTPLVTG